MHGDTAARDDFYFELKRKKRSGIRHAVVDPPDGSVYDGDRAVPELPNWIQPNGDLDPLFVEMVHEIRAIGLYLIFYCYGGGQADAPAIYDGRLRTMARRIRAEGWAPFAIVLWAWESFGRNPECTAKQNSDAWQVLHDELGDAGALLGAHVGSASPQRCTYASAYGYKRDEPPPTDCRGRACKWGERSQSWIEIDDPTDGDEIGAWYTGGAKFVAVFFGQLGVPPGAYHARQIEILDRYFPPGTPMPGVGVEPFRRDPDIEGQPDTIDDTPVARGPFWFAGERPGGVIEFCDWEPGIPYVVIRGQAGPADVERMKREADSMGIRSQGCLPVAA